MKNSGIEDQIGNMETELSPSPNKLKQQKQFLRLERGHWNECNWAGRERKNSEESSQLSPKTVRQANIHIVDVPREQRGKGMKN